MERCNAQRKDIIDNKKAIPNNSLLLHEYNQFQLSKEQSTI